MLVHKLIALFVLAIATNLDNFSVAFAYSMAGRRIPLLSNLLITLTTMVLTYGTMQAGKLVVSLFPVKLLEHLGAVVIITVGIRVLLESTDKANAISSPRPKDLPRSPFFSLKETLALGLSLSVDSMAGGFGAALSGGYNITLAVLAIGIASFSTIAIGQRLGSNTLSRRLRNLSQPIAGLFLVTIGIGELFF